MSEWRLEQWQGEWENFESYIDSEDVNLREAWQAAEQAMEQMPQKPPMFQGGVRAFWKKACETQKEGRNRTIGRVTIELAEREKGTGDAIPELVIHWWDTAGETLGSGRYRVAGTVTKGLEHKENLLLSAVGKEGWPFRYVLAMPPMPDRSERKNGALLSHFHFQFAKEKEELLREDMTLVNPMWYPTLCDGEGTTMEKCNVVLAMHRLPVRTVRAIKK